MEDWRCESERREMKEHIDTVELRRVRSFVGEGTCSSRSGVRYNELFRGGGRGGSGGAVLDESRVTSAAG